ncbi:MAG: replicative DNA helicase [Eubacteriales bacterium]
MEETFHRVMPHFESGERAVIAAMMKNNSVIPDVIGMLRAEDFYIPINRDAFQGAFTLFHHGQRIDMVTVRNQMILTGRYQESDLIQYMENLTADNISSAGVKSYVEMVKDRSVLRSVATISQELGELAFDETTDATPLLELAEQRFHALRQGRSENELKDIAEVLHNAYDHLNELAARGSAISGLPSGLVDVDKALSGLNPSDLILLAARPGMGKTSFALNILLNVGKYTDKTVVFFSLEMNEIQLALRLIATESFVDNKRLTSGQLQEDDWFKIKAACSALLETKIKVNDNPFATVADIKSKCRREENLGLIVIDYLQLMESDGAKGKSGGQNRQQTVSDISRALKIMAKELNVPVICLSQLSRASEKRESKRPLMSDLRDSGAIEQDADIIMFLYREDYYDQETENRNVAECIIAKNRHGEVKTVELEWLPTYTTFRNAPRPDIQPPPY